MKFDVLKWARLYEGSSKKVPVFRQTTDRRFNFVGEQISSHGKLSETRPGAQRLSAAWGGGSMSIHCCPSSP